MVQGQSLYGKQVAQCDEGALSLGRTLFPTLPEDIYDSGPQCRSTYRLVADVRLDNRADLSAALHLEPSRASQMSDAALLFEALLAWGEGAPERLVGEFAFAFWDGPRQRLLLCRDILGLRPLHFHRGDTFFAFASMPSGLHALNGVPYDLDTEFVLERLALLRREGSRTHFREIERVEPGYVVHVSRKGTRTAAYWNPPKPSEQIARPEEYEEGLRDVLDRAVAAQLRGAGNLVATQLSGGLDSSTVTATVARALMGGAVVAYTAVPRPGFEGRPPPGRSTNEAELAAATARLYPNIEHVLIESSGESPLRWLDSNFLYQQQPMSVLQNAAWGQAIHRAARDRGATTIFKGSLGNLTTSYSGLELLPALVSSGRFLTFASHLGALARNGMPFRSVAARTVGPFVPHRHWARIRRLFGRAAGRGSLSAVRISSLDEAGKRSGESPPELALRPDADPWRTRVDMFTHIDGGNAYKGVLAEWGLSVRDPMTDKRVIEYCLTVPPAEFLRGGVPRSLARRAFSDRLPPEVTRSRLRGFQAADWYEALDQARPEIEAEIEAIGKCPGADELIDLRWLAQAMDEWPTDGWNDDEVRARYRHGLLTALSAGHFVRKVRGPS